MAIVKGLNPSKILKNREKIAKQMIEKYHFTKLDLASFFYTNPSVMGKFLKERGIEPSKEQTLKNKQEVDKLKKSRDRRIKKTSKEKFASALERSGLWQLPEIKQIEIESLDDFPNATNAKQATEFLQFGFTYTDVKRYFELNKIQLKMIEQAFDAEKIKTGVELRTSRESFETIKDMVENGHDFQDALKATGSSISLNEKRFVSPESRKNYTYEEFLSYRKETQKKQLEYEIQKAQKKNPKERKSSEEKEALKEEVFRRWMNSEKTQLELEEEYGVTRVTIMNWCREMKIKHRKEISMPTVRRRNFSEKTLKERGLERYDNPGMMRLSSSEKVDVSTVESPFKKASDKKRKKVSDISQEIYKRKTEVLFGYGPNKGTSQVDGVIQPGYYERLQETTALGNEFANVEGAREHADTHEGEMKSFWDEKYGIFDEEKEDIE